ncbi:SET domain-containing protein [Actinoplanes sp. NPDC023714]|uniref:SET domain-containing protein n=1 Tax=Actinoplanes sp. NPDC023714 TaxID=3154322 RepID=UPI0033FEC02A
MNSSGVRLGAGDLAGFGVVAARDFAAGEVVLSYDLRPLTLADYRALPAGEDLFVHSFGGRRFLYPPPARFVNHADDPSCRQDFDRRCHVALRPLRAGDPITIDCHEETARELTTFLEAYQRAGPAELAALTAAGAKLWPPGRHARPLSGVEWLVGTGRWEALCSATLPGGRHATLLLKVIEGNWQLVYQHVG